MLAEPGERGAVRCSRSLRELAAVICREGSSQVWAQFPGCSSLSTIVQQAVGRSGAGPAPGAVPVRGGWVTPLLVGTGPPTVGNGRGVFRLSGAGWGLRCGNHEVLLLPGACGGR